MDRWPERMVADIHFTFPQPGQGGNRQPPDPPPAYARGPHYPRHPQQPQLPIYPIHLPVAPERIDEVALDDDTLGAGALVWYFVMFWFWWFADFYKSGTLDGFPTTGTLVSPIAGAPESHEPLRIGGWPFHNDSRNDSSGLNDTTLHRPLTFPQPPRIVCWPFYNDTEKTSPGCSNTTLQIALKQRHEIDMYPYLDGPDDFKLMDRDDWRYVISSRPETNLDVIDWLGYQGVQGARSDGTWVIFDIAFERALADWPFVPANTPEATSIYVCSLKAPRAVSEHGDERPFRCAGVQWKYSSKDVGTCWKQLES